MEITELYISRDDLTYNKLDLFKNEPITIKQTSKDLTDITKVFTPYSQSFTIPASDKNKDLVGWFGFEKSEKNYADFKFNCKIYINLRLIFTGILTVNNGQFETDNPNQFNVSFTSTTTDLKAIIGEDTLQDLGSLPIDYSPRNVKQLLSSGNNTTVNGVNVSYLIPFVSMYRVWSYDSSEGATVLDNLCFNPALSPLSERVINPNELRPAIYIKSIFDLIVKKYNLNIVCPLFNTLEGKSMLMWCNEVLPIPAYKRLSLQNNFIHTSPTYKMTYNPTDSSFKMVRGTGFRETFIIFDLVGLDVITADTAEFNVKLIDKNNGREYFYTQNITNVTNQFIIRLANNQFTSNVFEFYIEFQFTQLLKYDYLSIRGRFISGGAFPILYESNVGDTTNSLFMKSYFMDIMKALPKTKVIDFITSFTKTFNISIINNNPNKTDLYWLRKNDIDSYGLKYSKNTLDYTPYVDGKSIVKSSQNQYNKYNFKHATSKYFSNVKYKQLFGQEYGQVIYPPVDPPSPKEMKIETGFSIIPPVSVIGLPNLITAYGFKDGEKTVIPSGATRYSPNYGEPTIFHKLNNNIISNGLGIKDNNTSGALINSELKQFNIVAPFNSNNNSLAFSNIIFNSIEYASSLFLQYYSKDIIRLLSPNIMLNNFTLILPSSEVSINESTTSSTTTLTPIGFRIQNDIIIKEILYSIIDSQIDITTGKAKLQLLNY